MASVLRRTEDLQRLKTRELVFQYADGSYPGLYRVAVIDTTLGRVGWAPATIDMSGSMSVPGDLDVSGTLTVGSTAFFNGDVDISGTLTVGSTIYALGDLDVSGSATVDGTLTVGSTAFFNGDVDISGTLTVSSLETCELVASQGRFTVDCSYGYISIQPNTGPPPGLTAGSFNDSRIEMYCDNGITAQRDRLRIFAQKRFDDQLTEARIVLIDSSGQYVAPGLQFDASEEMFRIVSYIPDQFSAMSTDLSTGKSRFGTDKSEGSSILTVLGRQTIVLDTAAGTTVDTVFQCRYDPSYNDTAPHNFSTLSVFPNQPAGTTSFQIVSFEFDAGSTDKMGTPLILNPDLPGIINGRGNVGVGITEPRVSLDVSGSFAVSEFAPSSSTDPAGAVGQISWGFDSGTPYLYLCQAGSSWARVALAGW